VSLRSCARVNVTDFILDVNDGNEKQCIYAVQSSNSAHAPVTDTNHRCMCLIDSYWRVEGITGAMPTVSGGEEVMRSDNRLKLELLHCLDTDVWVTGKTHDL